MRDREMSFSTRQLTILGLMVGILLLLPYTPLGYLNIGPLAITFNMIPVAICAITLGPIGGVIAGAVFGLTSFCQCFGGLGIGMSAMGAILFGINPFLAFVQRFVPRALIGFLLGYIFRWAKRIKGIHYRFFCCISKYGVFYAGSDITIWEHGVCAGINWRTKYDCLCMCICRHQCSG